MSYETTSRATVPPAAMDTRSSNASHESDVDAGLDALSPNAPNDDAALSGANDTMAALPEDLLNLAKDYVREHPLATVAISVAAGLALSRLMSSDHDES